MQAPFDAAVGATLADVAAPYDGTIVITCNVTTGPLSSLVSLALSSADGADTIGEDPRHLVIEPSGRTLCPRARFFPRPRPSVATSSLAVSASSWPGVPVHAFKPGSLVGSTGAGSDGARARGARGDQFLRTGRPSGCTPLSARVESASFAVRSPIPT